MGQGFNLLFIFGDQLSHFFALKEDKIFLPMALP